MLFDLLQPARRTAVVDIGANPIDGIPPYRSMLDLEICTVIGFDPQCSAMNRLKERVGPLETYLPYAVADGKERTLYTCFATGMTSVLRPDVQSLSLFPLFEEFGRIIATEQIQTLALDDIDEIENVDFLKIDVQGAEFSIFQSGRHKLSRTVAIQTEVSFLPLYVDQPTFGEVDRELRSQGFVPHAQFELKRWILSPLLLNDDPRQPLNQLIEADFVYVRDFRKPRDLSDEQLKHLASISHHCYQSFDLAMYCLRELESRGSLAIGSQEEYRKMLAAYSRT